MTALTFTQAPGRRGELTGHPSHPGQGSTKPLPWWQADTSSPRMAAAPTSAARAIRRCPIW